MSRVRLASRSAAQWLTPDEWAWLTRSSRGTAPTALARMAALKKAAATQAYVFAVDRPAGGEEPPAREGVALVDAYWLPPDEPLRAIADTAPVPLRRAEAAPNDHQLSRLVDRPWFADLRECSWCVTFSTLIIGATVPGVALFWRSRQQAIGHVLRRQCRVGLVTGHEEHDLPGLIWVGRVPLV